MDEYDKHIEYLTEDGEECFKDLVANDWNEGVGLFRFCNKSGKHPEWSGSKPLACGCLTMVRSGGAVAETDALTAAIRADDRLPTNERDIEPHHLPVFAEWQRRLDKELNRA